MPNDRVNIEQHIETYLLKTCVITENARLRIYSSTNPKFITFSTLNLGTTIPQSRFI
jgi:hypothetical protein